VRGSQAIHSKRSLQVVQNDLVFLVRDRVDHQLSVTRCVSSKHFTELQYATLHHTLKGEVCTVMSAPLIAIHETAKIVIKISRLTKNSRRK